MAPDIRFRGDTRSVLGRYVYLFGTWQPNLTAYLAKRLEPGTTFVDVGANVGWFTLQAARHVGPSGRVVAIEASPALSHELHAAVERNNATNVRVLNAAVWSAPGMVDISPGPAENTGMTRVVPGTEVPCNTLQSLLTAEEIGTARVVKIDVEGAEREVVRGIDPRRFPRATEFVIEVEPANAREVFEAFDGYNAFLLPNSYRLSHYMLDRPPSALARVSRISEVADIVFSREETIALQPS